MNKEVEEALKDLEEMKYLEYNPEAKVKVINVVLNYIKELEANNYESNNIINEQIDLLKDSISKQIIRDKISLFELEIETLKTLYPKSYTRDDDYKLYVYKNQVLKELLEEK